MHKILLGVQKHFLFLWRVQEFLIKSSTNLVELTRQREQGKENEIMKGNLGPLSGLTIRRGASKLRIKNLLNRDYEFGFVNKKSTLCSLNKTLDPYYPPMF